MIDIKNIVGLWGVPRSGTSWLGQIFNSSSKTIYRYQPLFSYEFKNAINERSSSSKIKQFFESIEKSKDPFVINGMSNKIEIKKTSFKKSKIPSHLIMKHVRYHEIIENLINKNNQIKIVAIVRNPYATIYSWINASKEFNSNWDIEDEWFFAKKKNLGNNSEYFGFQRWKDATQIYISLASKFPGRILIIKYSDLLKKPIVETKRIFDKVELEFTDQTKSFIQKSRNEKGNYDYSVYNDRKTDTDWISKLPKYIVHAIKNDLKNTIFEEYLD